MPLRDHFRPPLKNIISWDGFHGGWPMVIVQQLRKTLPPGYVAQPRAYSGGQLEIDIAAFENEDLSRSSTRYEGGGVATAVWAQARPSVSVDTSLPDYDEYEVRIFDTSQGRLLVAAIEIVSPANKDRPEHRNLFVAKCAALLHKGVAVSIVDLVTIRKFNLYADLMTFMGHSDPTLDEPPSPIYAASCRLTSDENRTTLESWSHQLTLGQPLPTLPLWLRRDLVVPLELESSYEQTCHDLWIS